MKTCKKCGIEKEEVDFPIMRENSLERRHHCLDCRKAYWAKRYDDNAKSREFHMKKKCLDELGRDLYSHEKIAKKGAHYYVRSNDIPILNEVDYLIEWSKGFLERYGYEIRNPE